ncbi:MAG: ATP-binding protein [Balneolales bacterium]
MNDQQRINNILKLINKFTASNYRDREDVSDKRDELDAIIVALGHLNEDLTAKKERVNSLIEVLLRFTVMDFSDKAAISSNRDDIDAIAMGLNALAEEMEHSMKVQNALRKETEIKADQLEAANNELESFTYSVSHDLRTPLRAIHGYSQVLFEDCSDNLNGECRRALKAIMHNAKKMGQLIDELLTFSRLGRKELNKSTLNTRELVESVTSKFEELQNERAELVIHPLPPIYADQTLMGLVFQNLISNAIKYSSKKELTRIEIGVTETDKGQAYFVKDNGAGFDMAYYEKLFGVFQRLHRDDEFEGTGVGLPIVQRIILRHGGTVWAEGTVNEGATFYFTVSLPKQKE